ncbi:MAG TPA: DUF882 domain-containing protein [Burkholderiales bacterium]|nr:DUF882 domain-containing protein [Burkholderiales bacterium]
MPDRHLPSGPTQWGRRQFLRYAGTAALLIPCGGALASAAEQRTLKFVHTHTGEKLTACYAVSGGYQSQCLTQVNRFLRDFRTGESHPIDPALLDVLYDLQVAAGRDDTFEVISAYRSPRTNSQLRSQSSGVAEHSLHMDGKAIDIRLTGFPTKKLRDLALSLRRGGVGFYASSDFVHVDTGRVRFW